MLGDTIGVPTVPAGRFAALVQVAVVVPETVAVEQLQLISVPVKEENVVPAGSGSVTVTALAGSGPAFRALIV
jgi:hypothetical protein